ncbi:Hydroxysteroid 11-beta-dehydrogenase 1-like protein [Oryzias melastigma]|uniref:Hydroxysteroid 11-beta-dehydrogenase 1-like protein n=1 Tax=Oryzias melastigma TaxID=30732 RepID=A0A834C005_ORYME|nr:Hydroxysteroid 11-beta-dehydrogenase 1-like protein [Oryzias melastigma]
MASLAKVLTVSLCVLFLALRWTSPTFDPETLRGARVLVTGASSGIGEQMAYHYARFGAQIVITARREKVLQQVVEECLRLGAQKAVSIAADMSTDSDPDRVVDSALETLGGLDFLVLNHIGPSYMRMWDGDHEHVRQLMKINFHSYVQMAGRALPFLEQTRGALVVVSSIGGRVNSPFVAPYTSTKFALNGFFGSLHHELAMKKSNVSISICTLGLIDTASAMKHVREFSDMPAYPAADAALNIIITGATRQRELFYPWFTQLMALTKDWSPSLSDYIIQKFYKTS